jgi:hypothetical protein
VWVDVEHYPPWEWSTDKARNRAVLRGVLAGYAESGIAVGFYSTTYQWSSIVGAGGPTGHPEWRTSGTRRAEVAGKCSSGSFAAGPAVLSQWWTADADHDVVCPAADRPEVLVRYFTGT